MALPLERGIATDEIVDAINELHALIQTINNNTLVDMNSTVQWLVGSVQSLNTAVGQLLGQ